MQSTKDVTYLVNIPLNDIYNYTLTPANTYDGINTNSLRLNKTLIPILKRSIAVSDIYTLNIEQRNMFLALVLSIFVDSNHQYTANESIESSFSRMEALLINFLEHFKNNINQKFLDKILNYVSNIYQHFYLYQWTIENDREINLTVNNATLHTIPNTNLICPLSQGVPKDIWELQNKKEQLENAFNERKFKLENDLAENNSLDAINTQFDSELMSLTHNMTHDEVLNFASSLTSSLCNLVMTRLSLQFEYQNLSVEYSLDVLNLDIESKLQHND